jgi:exosome complex RNA-binding protein Rrp42 (RNase PH superfamily)
VILQVLNDDGNIRDCMLLAAVAALSNAKLPPVVVDKQDGIVSIVQEDENHFVTKLCGGDDDSSTNNIPIPLTVGFVQLDNKKEEMTILVDPTRLEEEHCDSTCCIVVTAGAANNMNNTTNQVVNNCEVSGRVAISSQQLALVAQMAKGRARELFELLT